MAKSKCSFNDLWLKEFFWIQPVPNNRHAALCTLCNSRIYLSNMGRGAIISHRNGATHKRREKQTCQSVKITDFSATKNTVDSVKRIIVPETENTTETVVQSVLPLNVPDGDVQVHMPSTSNGVPAGGIKKFMLKEDITKAEILWCLEVVATHRSLRSAEKDVKMFSHIFTDSEIAKGMQLGRDKTMYYLVFGIAPFFKDQLTTDLLLCDHFVIGFDESLNKVAQRQQMDVNIRYWCSKENVVKTRYLNSVFLGRSCAEDLLAAFRDATRPLNLKKLLQVSMDGPNVNLKFFKELSVSIKQTPEDPEILNIGCCGLHSINLAFKTGAKCVDWSVLDFMRALYYVFKDSPARRALYTLYTNSHEFPKKFCSVRWLENSQVAERCIKIFPNIKIFVKEAEKGKSAPTSQSYMLVKKLINDLLLPAKLAFFHSVAVEFESFLRRYQSDVPLVAFIYDDLTNLMFQLMKRFVKKDVLSQGDYLQVDVENVSNYLPCNEVDVGISALYSIRKAKQLSEGKLTTFYKDCRKFLVSCVKKLKERSPLLYEMTKAVSCFNPLVTLNDSLFNERLTNLLLILCEKNWLTSVQADRAKNQFLEACLNSSNISKLKSYDRTNRIDLFWFEMLSINDGWNDAVFVVKMVMVLSHGNSNVERGFSINKDSLWENMKEETIIARRLIYDAVSAHGSLTDFEVTKQMILSVRNSRAKYMEEKERRSKEEKEMVISLKRKKQTEIQLKELQAKKSKILNEAQKETLKIEEEIASIKLLQKKL